MLYVSFENNDCEFFRNKDKNEWLKKNRNISFEEVVSIIISGDGLMWVIPNPNQNKYPGQEAYLVMIEGYMHIVPFEKTWNDIYLKTIFPSRKAKKLYS